MLLIFLAIVFGFIALISSVLFYFSPGKPETFKDKNGNKIYGSISEKKFVIIGGVKQGMFIRSRNINNPVLLFIHGGPAFSEYFLFEKYKPNLEDYFTVCYWEQRGAGLSSSSKIPLESMTFNQLTSDAIEVSNFLRKRFRKEKIYLMAHSGGTVVGIKAASEAPQLYHAYIGVAQITNQAASEKMAYKYMVERYSALADRKALKQLIKYPILNNNSSISQFYKSSIRDKSMHQLGIGTMRNMKSVFWGIFIPVCTCKAYTIKEKINIWQSKFTFLTKAEFVKQLFSIDIPITFPKLDLPIYFLSGQYDLTVNHNLSKNYLHQLKAPIKGFYTFKNSAHSPIFEEPAFLKKIIELDILKGTTFLADKN